MCDTFVALGNATCDGSIIFGKNSDREPNEAQVLEYHPAQTFRGSMQLHCTYLSIPQAREIQAVLLSRPFWMWGAEMGANEKGVVIGNEAVWTKMPLNRQNALTGMDLIRLALERSTSAPSAMESIIQLIADYGQGGVCGYEDKHMTYHNSFIIADPQEAWVLETAGPLWAAIKVKDVYSISNGLTIGEEFDESHPDLIETARKKGWLKKGRNFNFAETFSDWFFTTFSACKNRQNRSQRLMDGRKGRIDVAYAFDMLRDHGDSNYRPDSHFLGNRICAHAGNRLARKATQTTASLVAHLNPHSHVYWATGTSSPCSGIFKPIWFNGKVLPDIGEEPGQWYNADSLWWRHESLHRSVLVDFQQRLRVYSEERDRLEQSFLNHVESRKGENAPDLTQQAFAKSMEATDKWVEQVRQTPIKSRTKSRYRSFWKSQNSRANINTTELS